MQPDRVAVVRAVTQNRGFSDGEFCRMASQLPYRIRLLARLDRGKRCASDVAMHCTATALVNPPSMQCFQLAETITTFKLELLTVNLSLRSDQRNGRGCC